jgi:hypothetical protein
MLAFFAEPPAIGTLLAVASGPAVFRVTSVMIARTAGNRIEPPRSPDRRSGQGRAAP